MQYLENAFQVIYLTNNFINNYYKGKMLCQIEGRS